jgi:hypothetical protein
MVTGAKQGDDFHTRYLEATRLGEERRKKDPFAASINYIPEREEYFIRLESGQGFTILMSDIPELKEATPAQIKSARRFAQGEGIRWEPLDLDIATSTLLSRSLGWAVQRVMMKKAGKATSAKKAASSAANGKLGGRPKKVKPEEFASTEPER